MLHHRSGPQPCPGQSPWSGSVFRRACVEVPRSRLLQYLGELLAVTRLAELHLLGIKTRPRFEMVDPQNHASSIQKRDSAPIGGLDCPLLPCNYLGVDSTWMNRPTFIAMGVNVSIVYPSGVSLSSLGPISIGWNPGNNSGQFGLPPKGPKSRETNDTSVSTHLGPFWVQIPFRNRALADSLNVASISENNMLGSFDSTNPG